MAFEQAALFFSSVRPLEDVGWEGGKLWPRVRQFTYQSPQPSPTLVTGLIAASVPKSPVPDSYKDLSFALSPDSY